MLKIVSASLICCSAFTLQAKPILTVYTYDSFIADWGPGPTIKPAFEQICNCELKLIGLNDGVALLNRLRMEGKNSPADIVLGLDNNLIDLAKKTGLFTESRIDRSQLKLPIKWDNNIFIPYDYGYFAFIYDKTRVTHVPKSLDELINSSQPWKIIYQDPRTSTPGLGLLLWIQKIYGKNSAQAWQKMAAKTVTVTKGWSESYGLFLKGESDFVLSYSSSPGFHLLNDKKNNYAAAIFSEGHYLQIEVAAQLATSKQPKLAQQFIQFMLSPTVQKTLPTTNWMYPIIDIPLPKVYQQLAVPKKSLQFNAEDITQHRNHWIYLWQNAVSHQ
ncbi:thiamine ABC transporter substrate binding subunit [Arsenophonus nasoniae]|uniref:Thiamine-binding periplasmic protein n=1 Tax=Arsenophonus nasoniae TaxID=638 RepID=A0ABY8NVX2_9GAMM|nr:thiamine ABC transporter substrate binding subunit [Arsenophonus nasoniae]WGM07655.1 thiamine ABC transporter substrate binding subunit [Arsenophonus nasoniae]WGM12556.1 thiamine ABC transporter substrate binding subunit [Arsenophonus nasoniae]WGM17228.1 thiamine ABC transporter substrate binding subunit [Arsenophonus nasoniae]